MFSSWWHHLKKVTIGSRLRLEVGSFCFCRMRAMWRHGAAWRILPCTMNIYCLCDLIYTYLPKEIYCNDKVSTAHSVTATSIAATLFLWFMAGNGILYNPDGTKRIVDNTLVALTLMIAESRTEEKDVIVKVVVSLINKNNYE